MFLKESFDWFKQDLKTTAHLSEPKFRNKSHTNNRSIDGDHDSSIFHVGVFIKHILLLHIFLSFVSVLRVCCRHGQLTSMQAEVQKSEVNVKI